MTGDQSQESLVLMFSMMAPSARAAFEVNGTGARRMPGNDSRWHRRDHPRGALHLVVNWALEESCR
jgi:hypothetical protein